MSLYILYKEYHIQRIIIVINLIFGIAMYMQSNFQVNRETWSMGVESSKVDRIWIGSYRDIAWPCEAGSRTEIGDD